MPEEEEVREQLQAALDKGQVDLVLAPSDATFQKLWDHYCRWASVVSTADIAYRRGVSEAPGYPAEQRKIQDEFVENLVLDWGGYSGKELERELQDRIEKYGLKEQVIEQARSQNKAEIQEVSGQLMVMLKDALKRMRGE